MKMKLKRIEENGRYFYKNLLMSRVLIFIYEWAFLTWKAW